MVEPEKLRVLAVMPGINADAGAERSFVDTFPGLAAAGIEMHLALLTDRRALVPAVEAAGGIVHDLSANRTLVPRVRALRGLIRELQPAVVHATLYEATLPAQIASIGLPPTMLVTWAATTYTKEHFAGLTAPMPKLRTVQASEVVLARLARTRFHAVTSGVSRINRGTIKVPLDRVLVGERGRDPKRFEIAADEVDRARSGLGAKPDTRFVLAVGRQDYQKAYDLLLTQFDEVADTHPEARLIVAGRDGSATPQLREVLADMRHGDRVEFLGNRTDVPVLMTMADVVVCSSLREGAAGALIETMACRTPIVCVPLFGQEDVLTDGENALVPPRDQLGRAISRVLDDPELAKRLGEAGRETFERRFTLERSAARSAEIYREVA